MNIIKAFCDSCGETTSSSFTMTAHLLTQTSQFTNFRPSSLRFFLNRDNEISAKGRCFGTTDYIKQNSSKALQHISKEAFYDCFADKGGVYFEYDKD